MTGKEELYAQNWVEYWRREHERWLLHGGHCDSGLMLRSRAGSIVIGGFGWDGTPQPDVWCSRYRALVDRARPVNGLAR